MTNEIIIKKLDIDMVPQQIEFFNLVVDSAFTKERWLYKHTKNPQSSGCNIFGAFDGDRLIGMNTFIPAKYSCNGIIYHGMQAADGAFYNEYRGRGIYQKLIKYAEQYYRDTNIQYITGFPNAVSYKALVKCGWIDIGNIQSVNLRYNLAYALKRKLGIPVPRFFDSVFNMLNVQKARSNLIRNKDIEVEFSKDNIITEQQFAGFAPPDYVSFSIDKGFLNWISNSSITASLTYCVAKRDNQIKAALIFITGTRKNTHEPAMTKLVYWGAEKGEEKCLEIALSKYLFSHKNNSDIIWMWLPADNEKSALFKKNTLCTYPKNKRINPFLLCVLSRDEKIKQALLNNPWNHQLIETDTIV